MSGGQPKGQNLDSNQDIQLNDLREKQLVCTLITKNGVRLIGKVEAFDKFVVLLQLQTGKQSLVYKHAISTIMSEK